MTVVPEGFVFEQEFLDPAEEQTLIGFISALPFGSIRMRGAVARRRSRRRS